MELISDPDSSNNMTTMTTVASMTVMQPRSHSNGNTGATSTSSASSSASFTTSTSSSTNAMPVGSNGRNSSDNGSSSNSSGEPSSKRSRASSQSSSSLSEPVINNEGLQRLSTFGIQQIVTDIQNALRSQGIRNITDEEVEVEFMAYRRILHRHRNVGGGQIHTINELKNKVIAHFTSAATS